MAKQGAEEKRSLEVAEEARELEWSRPSFVSKLFMGEVEESLVFPFPEQSEEDRKAGDKVLAELKVFLAEHLDADRVDEEKEIPEEVLEGLKERGLYGIKIPAEHGGLGLSQVNYNRIIELVSSHCASTAVLLSAHQSIGVPQPLKMFGTREQKEKYLPRLAKGALSAFALTEPEVGSDPARMTTRALPTEDGEAWLITGRKLWISNGPTAELLIVMARTNDPSEKKPQITAFIVETDTPGFSTEHRCDFMGLKGIHNGLMRFDQVRVPKENILVGLGEGLKLALRTLNTGRLTLPAASAGAMKQALAMALPWSRERKQWGQPIGHHDAVASKIARASADLFAVESLTWLTSAMADAGDTDIRLEAAMAKLFCSEALWRTADEMLQVRGGRGYETAQSLAGRKEPAMPMERLVRDARINLIIEGSSEIMRLFIAREALDPHMKIAGASATSEKINLLGAAKFYTLWYPKLWLPSFERADSVPYRLSGHLRYLRRGARMLARDLFHMMMLHRQGLQKRQMLLARLVDTGMELFAMAAVLSRAASPRAPRGSEDMADLFCRQARRRIKEVHRAVYCNDDRAAYRVARAVVEGQHPWLEENILCTWKD